jgi:hypothetical protein
VNVFCAYCGEDKHERHFAIASNTSSGRRAKCKACDNAHIKPTHDTAVIRRLKQLLDRVEIILGGGGIEKIKTICVEVREAAFLYDVLVNNLKRDIRVCIKCNKPKPREDFLAASGKYIKMCRVCHNKYENYKSRRKGRPMKILPQYLPYGG